MDGASGGCVDIFSCVWLKVFLSPLKMRHQSWHVWVCVVSRKSPGGASVLTESAWAEAEFMCVARFAANVFW